MLFQFDILTSNSLLGIGIMFGFALLFTFLTYRSMGAFFIWLMVFNAFVVWSGLLPLWTLILNIIIVTIVIFISSKNIGSVIE